MTRPALEPSAPFFRSQLQAALLARLLERVDEWIPITELASAARSHQVTRLELRRLVDAGIVEQDSSTRPHRFRIPADGPLTRPLGELVARTVGIEALLRRRLAAIRGVKAAALFGSWAAHTVTPDSDVDVLVLTDGDLEMDALHELEDELAASSGRQLDLVVFPVDEARAKLAAGSGFLRTLLDAQLVPLVGDVRGALRGDST